MGRNSYLYTICILILSIEFDFSILIDEGTFNIRQFNLVLLMGFCLLPPKIVSSRQKIRFHSSIFIYALYVFYCGISAAWSFDAGETIGRWIGLCICLFVAYNLLLRFTYVEFLSKFVQTVVITLIISWVLYFIGFKEYTLNPEEFFRFKGIYNHALRLAMIIAPTAFILSSKIPVYSDNKYKYLGLIILLATILSTQGRSIVTFTALILLYQQFDGNRKYSFLIILTGAILAIILSINGLPDAVTKFYERGEGDVTQLTGRTLIWAQLIPLILKNLTLGHGYASFKTHPVQLGTSYIPEHAHNIWLHQTYETGLIGTVIFTTFLIMCFLISLKYFNHNKYSFLKYFIIYILMAGMTGVPVGANVSILYFVLILVALYESDGVLEIIARKRNRLKNIVQRQPNSQSVSTAISLR